MNAYDTAHSSIDYSHTSYDNPTGHSQDYHNSYGDASHSLSTHHDPYGVQHHSYHSHYNDIGTHDGSYGNGLDSHHSYHNYGDPSHSAYDLSNYLSPHTALRSGSSDSGHPSQAVSLDSQSHGYDFASTIHVGDSVYVQQKSVEYKLKVTNVTSSGGEWQFTVVSNDGFYNATIPASEIQSKA
jgi:hypothetical protein